MPPLGDIEQTYRIRPEKAHLARSVRQCLLPGAARISRFREPAGQHDCRSATPGRKRFDRRHCQFRPDQDDGHVRRARQRGDIGITAAPVDFFGPGIDRPDVAAEAVFLQEVQRPSADFRRIGRGADDSDAARPEQAVERGAGQVYFRLSRKADTASRCESVV
jgi:hypothetical protein